MIFTRSTISALIERPRPNGMTLSSSSIPPPCGSHYSSSTARLCSNRVWELIFSCIGALVQNADIRVRCVASNLQPGSAPSFITSALRGSSSWQINCHSNVPAPSHAKQVSRTMKAKRGIPMREPKGPKSAIEGDSRASEPQASKSGMEGLSRRTFLGVGSASLASAALASLAVNAQERADTEKADHDHSASNPGPENQPVLDENPNSNLPPPTDHGHIEPIWYSFDLTYKRVEEGGWTNEVTEKVLPPSKDLAGVRMRLTAGSFRELHWHTADEWSIMLYGNARVTCLNPDGTVFIGDVDKD